jgi:hypothetical protein
LLKQIFQSFEQGAIDQLGLDATERQDLPGQNRDPVRIMVFDRAAGLDLA